MSEQKNKSGLRLNMNGLWSGIKHLVLHNGWLKLIAVLISVCLWAGLISQDENITRDKSFQNVKVSVTGVETLKNNKFIVVSDLDELTASFVAAVPQKQYDKAKPSDYNVRLDLTRINKTGEQEVELQSTRTNLYGTVTAITPKTVTVDVEEYSTRRIPVQVNKQGDDPENWHYIQKGCDPEMITVSGPSSLVSEIYRARVLIHNDDIEWNEGTTTVQSEFELYNRAGDLIDRSLISTTSASIDVDRVTTWVQILPRKTFSLEDLIEVRGKPKAGYEITGIQVEPRNVWIADNSTVLDQLDNLPLESRVVNVNNMIGTGSFTLRINKPSETCEMSTTAVTVTVEVSAVEP